VTAAAPEVHPGSIVAWTTHTEWTHYPSGVS
jgi:hypothetical protein